MSNKHELIHNHKVDFWIYESGEDNYSINMSVDEDNVDARIHIGGQTSKQIIEMALEMISAVTSWSDEKQLKQQRILKAATELQLAVKESK